MPPLSRFLCYTLLYGVDDEKDGDQNTRASKAGCGFREEDSRYLVRIQEVESQDQADHFQASPQSYVEPDVYLWRLRRRYSQSVRQ